MSHRNRTKSTCGTIHTPGAEHSGNSMSWETSRSRIEVRDQFLLDRGRRSHFYGSVMASLHANLVWPRTLVVGTSEVGRIIIDVGRVFKEKNMKLEEQFMRGKTDRLWAWRIAYREEFNRVSSLIVYTIVVTPQLRINQAIQKTVDSLGLEFEYIPYQEEEA